VPERTRKLLNHLVDDEYLLGDGKKHVKTNLTFSTVFVILLSIMNLILRLIWDNIQGAIVNGALIAVCLLSLLLLYRLKRHEWALYLFAVGMMLYAYYILLFSTSNHFAPLLILIYPLLFCLFFGNAFARPYLTLLLISMLLFFSPLFDTWRVHDYTSGFYAQLPAIFVAFSLLSMFAEYIRKRTSQRLLAMFRSSYESANRDQLTGLFNRRAFYDVIAREQASARRHHTGLQLVMCDIDHFKVINDQKGHLGGDLCLNHLARLLLAQLREEDYCFRWGGEEFLMLLPNTSPAQALAVAQRLRDTIWRTPLEDGRVGEIRATMSFGVYAFDLELSADDNIARCDACLYRAKENGRNRVEQG